MRFLLAVIGATIILASPFARAQDALRCPENQNGRNLDRAYVYNGAPPNGEDMAPDEDGWNLDEYHSTGNKIYLVCRYGNTDAPLQYELPVNLDFCSMDGDNIDCR